MQQVEEIFYWKKMCFFHYLKSVCSVHSGLRDQIDRLKETLGGKVQSSGKAEDEKELDVRLAAIKVLISVSVFVAILVKFTNTESETIRLSLYPSFNFTQCSSQIQTMRFNNHPTFLVFIPLLVSGNLQTLDQYNLSLATRHNFLETAPSQATAVKLGRYTRIE